MKDRLATLCLALGALILFYAFFVPKPPANPDDVELPLSTGGGDDGYQAVWRWLRAQGIPAVALHEPYTRLSSRPRPAGNVLVTTLPHRLPARRGELEELRAWIGRGNTLLVMAALDDTPRWAVREDVSFLHSLERMTQLDFEPLADDTAATSKKERAAQAVRQLLEPQRIIVKPMGAHPLFEGVDSVLAISEFPASRWQPRAAGSSAVLAIGQREVPTPHGAAAEPAVWLQRSGEGQMVIFGFASPFSNRALAEKDNARLLSNIIAWSRAPEGEVIFDDDHQGAVAYYDAKAFFRDPRFFRTLAWILLLWFIFVLGSQPFRPSVDGWNPAGITGFIGVTGRFFASTLTPASAGRRLFENFFNGVRRDLGLREDGTPVWEPLAADARVPRAELAEAQRLYARTGAGKSVDLVRLHNILAHLRGKLQ